MHPSYDHSYKLHVYILYKHKHTHFHLCIHLSLKTSPEATFLSTKVGLVIGLGALSLALLSVFGGDLHTKVSQDSLEKISLVIR